MSQQAAIDQLKNDVANALEGAQEDAQYGFAAAGATLGGPLDKIRDVIEANSEVFDAFGPLIVTLVPGQYRLALNLAIQLAKALAAKKTPTPLKAEAPADPAADVETAIHQG